MRYRMSLEASLRIILIPWRSVGCTGQKSNRVCSWDLATCSYGKGMQRHSWRERTDHGVRFYRASHHASSWVLHSQLKGEEEWEEHQPISKVEWEKLREVLWKKYQRGRCPWELIDKIDKRLEDPMNGEGGPGKQL